MKPIDYLTELSFIRRGGTQEELNAANMIKSWLEDMGYNAWLESFDILDSAPGDGELTPIEPDGESVFVRPVGLSKCGETEGHIAILDVSEPEFADKKNLKDAIVFMQHYPRRKWLELFREVGVAAALTVLGIHMEKSVLTLSQTNAAEFGNELLLASISYDKAIKFIRDEVKRVKVKLKQEKYSVKSHNVVAELDGKSDRQLIVVAHFDTTPLSPGAQDNAAGTAEALGVAKRIVREKFVRRIKFIFCGSEEKGLLGAKSHVAAHADQLDKIDLVINLDVGGNPFSPIIFRSIGTQELLNYVKGILHQKGMTGNFIEDIYSSDNMPFSRRNVPSLAIARAGIEYKGHSPHDTAEMTCNEALVDIIDATEVILREIANSKFLPYERKISEELKKKIEDYFTERK